MIELRGYVSSGLGRGGHFVSLDGYLKRFQRSLGIDPFFGTLNIKLDMESAKIYHTLIESDKGMTIEAFQSNEGTFDEVKVFHAEIKGISCYLVAPKKSTHKDVAEIISEIHLRDRLDLKNGDCVKLKIFQNS